MTTNERSEAVKQAIEAARAAELRAKIAVRNLRSDLARAQAIRDAKEGK